MKIQCDVCNREEASVFCSADDAALCAACDHRVHHANKLAGKHLRFSLLLPSPTQFPLCDICQEKRAILFCQQDRAILCRDCDLPIHKANEHTQKHNRFLLTGIKLSATSALYSPPSPSASASAAASVTTTNCDPVPNLKSQNNSINQPISCSDSTISNPPTTTIPQISDEGGGRGGQNQPAATTVSGGGSTSSISKYLIETLPGWHVEDFLDSFPAPFGFSKTMDENVWNPFWDSDLERNLTSFSSESHIWVPQDPSLSSQSYGQISISSEAPTNMMKSSRNQRHDTVFTVPQISPPSNNSSKRSRNFW